MEKLLATAIAVVCVCFVWIGAGEAKTADAPPPRCDWVKAEGADHHVQVAQIDHCCVGSRRCPSPNENITECAFACNDMMDNCTGKLIRTGFPHVAFDGYTPDDCINFILTTPWCGSCP